MHSTLVNWHYCCSDDPLAAMHAVHTLHVMHNLPAGCGTSSDPTSVCAHLSAHNLWLLCSLLKGCSTSHAIRGCCPTRVQQGPCTQTRLHWGSLMLAAAAAAAAAAHGTAEAAAEAGAAEAGAAAGAPAPYRPSALPALGISQLQVWLQSPKKVPLVLHSASCGRHSVNGRVG
jgi:hypothetical protein